MEIMKRWNILHCQYENLFGVTVISRRLPLLFKKTVEHQHCDFQSIWLNDF